MPQEANSTHILEQRVRVYVGSTSRRGWFDDSHVLGGDADSRAIPLRKYEVLCPLVSFVLYLRFAGIELFAILAEMVLEVANRDLFP